MSGEEYYQRNDLLWRESSSDDFESEDENIQVRSRAPRNFRLRFNNFQRWNDEEFKMRFRLSKETVAMLEERFGEVIAPKTKRNHAISAMDQILLVLRFCATGCMLQTIGDFCGIHKSTAGQIVKKVINTLASLSQEYIFMPRDQQEIWLTQEGFHKIARFPQVIGAIDCTHEEIMQKILETAKVTFH